MIRSMAGRRARVRINWLIPLRLMAMAACGNPALYAGIRPVSPALTAAALGSGWPVWLALGVIALVAGGVIGLEFMIDRSGISRFLLYVPYVLLLALPAVCGFVFKKRSNYA